MLFNGIVGWAQDFNPSDPAEPGQLKWKLTLLTSPSGAGSVSGSGYYATGESVTVTASANSDWVFVNWTDKDGTLISSQSSFTFTKAAANETLIANFAFNPQGPGEPGELPHLLTLVAGEGGSVSGGGYYRNGTTANINATASDDYYFVGWFNTNGTLYSADASTTYTMGDESFTLTARFAFNPGSPAEPGEVNLLRLKLIAQEGGTVSADKYNLKQGETTTVRANPNTGYVFTGWYIGDLLYKSEPTFTLTMGGLSVTLEARFQFLPDSPGEPGNIEQRTFSFTLRNAITKPGKTIQFPILLTPLATLGNMTFQLNFDPRLNVDIDNVTVAETTTAYQLTRETVYSNDAGYVPGLTSYRFTLTGGSMVVGENETPTVTPILTFPIIIPADIETNSFFKISINQISMTNEDGSTQTAGTRNGRVSVYKNGDANGDDEVSIIDAVSVVDCILGNRPEGFIEEAANTNDDEGISIIDAVGVVDIILDESGGNGARQDPIIQQAQDPD
jgi:hypothetical protein